MRQGIGGAEAVDGRVGNRGHVGGDDWHRDRNVQPVGDADGEERRVLADVRLDALLHGVRRVDRVHELEELGLLDDRLLRSLGRLFFGDDGPGAAPRYRALLRPSAAPSEEHDTGADDRKRTAKHQPPTFSAGPADSQGGPGSREALPPIRTTSRAIAGQEPPLAPPAARTMVPP